MHFSAAIRTSSHTVPGSMPMRSASPIPISSTASASVQTPRPVHGRRPRATLTTCQPSPSSCRFIKATSIGNRIKHICTLEQGQSSSAWDGAMLFRPIHPKKRRQNVSAISICKRGAPSDAPLAFHIAARLATRKRPFPSVTYFSAGTEASAEVR